MNRQVFLSSKQSQNSQNLHEYEDSTYEYKENITFPPYFDQGIWFNNLVHVFSQIFEN